ncbi:MAG TPA: nuclear transport factor 2 family protein [Pyrinomonadaceae bacterium]
MEPGRSETFVSPTEETVPLEDERALPPPRFDEKSIQRAQPAVPLTLRARARSWPTALIVLCVLGGVAGGVLGGLALTVFQRDGSRVASQTPAARPDSTGAAETAAATQPAPQDAQPAAEGAASPPTATVTQPAESAAQPAADAEARVESAVPAPETTAATREGASEADAGTQAELRAALGEWLAATNSRDVGRQMSYYAPKVEAFYLSRNAPREAVRAEKARLFARANSVNVEAAPPEIRMSRDGRTAVMRFRKRYQITGGEGARSGEVLQELRWRRTEGGWRIVSERDLRVLQ